MQKSENARERGMHFYVCLYEGYPMATGTPGCDMFSLLLNTAGSPRGVVARGGIVKYRRSDPETG